MLGRRHLLVLVLRWNQTYVASWLKLTNWISSRGSFTRMPWKVILREGYGWHLDFSTSKGLPSSSPPRMLQSTHVEKSSRGLTYGEGCSFSLICEATGDRREMHMQNSAQLDRRGTREKRAHCVLRGETGVSPQRVIFFPKKNDLELAV